MKIMTACAGLGCAALLTLGLTMGCGQDDIEIAKPTEATAAPANPSPPTPPPPVAGSRSKSKSKAPTGPPPGSSPRS